MEFGLLLPSGYSGTRPGWSPRDLVELAREAERLGFDSVWTGDSMVRARTEPLTLLAAIAQATERITLGTAALLPALRYPVQSALTLATLDQLANGRLVLGVGAGFPGFSEPEFALSGVRFGTRFAHLDDVVALWRALWTSSPKSFHGAVLHHDWLPVVPPPARPGGPPVWLAGATPAALRRTARHYDGWLPYPPDPADYAAGLATIRAAAGQRPVTPALFDTVHVLPDDDPAAGRRALAAFAESTYGRPLEAIAAIQSMHAGPVPAVVDAVRAYLDAGAEHVLLRVAAVTPAEFTAQLPLLAEVVGALRGPVPALS